MSTHGILQRLCGAENCFQEKADIKKGYPVKDIPEKLELMTKSVTTAILLLRHDHLVHSMDNSV